MPLKYQIEVMFYFKEKDLTKSKLPIKFDEYYKFQKF